MSTIADKGWLDRFPALARLGQPHRRIPVIRQLTETECGVACLAMVLVYFGKEISREEVRDILSAGRNGTSAKDILTGARYYGLRGRGLKLELEGVKYLEPAAILHWGFNHFVVFEGIDERGVDIVDPGMGRRRVSIEEFNRAFTGVALVLEPSENFVASKSDAGRKKSSVASIFWHSGEWSRIFVMSFFLLVLTLALPLFTGAIVDRVVPRGDRHLLEVLGIGLFAIVAFDFLASMIRAHLLLHLRTMVDVRMTLGMLEHLIALPYVFFQRRSSGDLLMRLNSNAVIREIMTSGMLTGVLDGALMLFYFILLFALSPSTGALVLAAGLLQIGVLVFTSGRRKELNATILAREARSQSYQVEMLAGIETLKAMGSEERAQERFSNLFVDVLNLSLARGRLNAAVDSVSATLRMGAPLVILGVGALQVLDGSLTLGAMLALNTFAVGVFTPLSNLASTWIQVQLLGGYIERINDIRDTPLEQDRAKVRLAGELHGRIEVEDVSFRYGPLDPLVVKDVSLKIEPGQFVAIVGRSGSGKSSLANLLLGLYSPSDGRILYDRVNLSELDLRSVRQKLGIVTQRTHLFNSTIRANLALADPDLPLDAIVEAAKCARIHDEIEQMPMKYETLLLDGGSSLSGGQRQRIALARALVRKPAVMLLDEATSALDAITEHEVQEELGKLQCTRIVIAHRLSTIRHADCILVMDGGRLVEQGTHAELLARNGLYAQLVSTQLDNN
jgi:ATP-binding cassette, subfamily B, bacterial